jgi:hypothetical protein
MRSIYPYPAGGRALKTTPASIPPAARPKTSLRYLTLKQIRDNLHGREHQTSHAVVLLSGAKCHRFVADPCPDAFQRIKKSPAIAGL